MKTQISRRPGFDRMAILAFQSKAPGMNLWFGMAARTLAGCSRKYLFLVAGRAIKYCMPPFQGENLGVLKTAKPVDSVMAIQAGLTKPLDMLRHKFGPAASGWIISCRMAICAHLKIKS
jgi:hypothetical protein